MSTPLMPSTTPTSPMRGPYWLGALGALALGLVLGAIDVGGHVDPSEWVHDPVLATRGFVRFIMAYGLLSLVCSTVLRWRALVSIAIATCTVLQCLAAYYHVSPQVRMVPGLLVLVSSAVAGAIAARAGLALVGRETPRRGLVAAVLGLTALVSSLAWLMRIESAPVLGAIPLPTTQVERQRPPASGPNVVLLTLDTLRADRLGVYGYTRVTTPNFDALARGGVVFTRAVSQAPLTPPSHASIFTGVYPTLHGIRAFSGHDHLREGRTTLAEVLRSAGYATGAIVAAAPLAPGTGLERGFDSYEFALPPDNYPFVGCRGALIAKVLKRLQLVPDRSAYWNGETQTNRALKWIRTRGSQPFFLWVHYFDAHDPYAPPRRHRRLAAHPGASLTEMLDRSYLYDSEVAYLDEQVGRLIDDLRQRGVLDDTIVVAISDHGEGLGEHNFVGHGYRLFQEQIRPVFLMRYPRQIPPDRTVTAQVRSIDLMPTLLDLLQIAPPPGMQGTSLLGTIAAPERHAAIALSETFFAPRQRLVAASDGRYKLIASLDIPGDQLFDLDEDPAETRNLVSSRPEVVARLRTAVDAYLKDDTDRSTDDGSRPVDPAIRERLRVLGYAN
jgi:arylsulfatase A-like enzyme